MVRQDKKGEGASLMVACHMNGRHYDLPTVSYSVRGKTWGDTLPKRRKTSVTSFLTSPLFVRSESMAVVWFPWTHASQWEGLWWPCMQRGSKSLTGNQDPELSRCRRGAGRSSRSSAAAVEDVYLQKHCPYPLKMLIVLQTWKTATCWHHFVVIAKVLAIKCDLK